MPSELGGWTLDLREGAAANAPEVPALPHLSDAARQTWLGRMRNEYASARVFETLARQLEAAGAPEAVVDECARFADEERRHGVLCGAVVHALGGEARAEMTPYEDVPSHDDASSPLEAALRNMLSICCLGETVAVALIGAERIEMPHGPLRDLLSRIYADEVGHARFGWRQLERLLPALDALGPLGREGLNAYLRVAFAHLEAHELAHLPIASRPPAEGAALGLCSGADARVLFYATVEQVIVPNLDRLGLRAGEAWVTREAEAA
jgi:hypothetical protein